MVGLFRSVAGAVVSNGQTGPSHRLQTDFLLEFSAGVNPEQSSTPTARDRDRAGSDSGGPFPDKNRLAMRVLEQLRKNGVEVRKVRASKPGRSAYGLHGRFETLLRQAEKLKLRKTLKEGHELGRSALFTMSRRHDFYQEDDPTQFFSSGERLELLEELVMEDLILRACQGMKNYEVDLLKTEESAKFSPKADGGTRNRRESSASQLSEPSQKRKRGRQTSMQEIIFGRFGDSKKNDMSKVKVIDLLIPLHDPVEADDLWRNWIRTIRPQPLRKILRYFGHARAFYFAFLGTYTFSLIPPAALGVAVFRTQLQHGGFDNLPTVLYLGFLAMWSTIFVEYWRRKQATLAFDWDSLDFEETDEGTREAFKEKAEPVYHPVADEYRWVYPSYKKAAAFCFSFLVCFALSAFACGAMTFFLVLDTWAKEELVGPQWDGVAKMARFLPLVCYMGIIQATSFLNGYLAEILTDLENHRTESSYQNSRIIKLVTLQFFNYHLSPFYVAFYERDMNKLYATVLALLGFYQVLGQLIEIGVPVVKALTAALRSVLQMRKAEKATETQTSTPPFALDSVGQSDALLLPQEDLFPEYLELWIQFGQVTLFSAVFPLAALLALMNNIIEMKTDALKMLRFERRGIGRRASGIGSWLDAFDVVGFLAVVTNLGLIGIIFAESELTAKYFKGWTNEHLIIFLVLAEHCVIFLKVLVEKAIPDLSDELAFLLRARRIAREREANQDFDIKSHVQTLLMRDRTQFSYRDSTDQGRQLLSDALNTDPAVGSEKTNVEAIENTKLMQWILDQEERRRRAQKYERFYKDQLDQLRRDTRSRFSEIPQALNLFMALVAVILLVTREARAQWSVSQA